MEKSNLWKREKKRIRGKDGFFSSRTRYIFSVENSKLFIQVQGLENEGVLKEHHLDFYFILFHRSISRMLNVKEFSEIVDYYHLKQDFVVSDSYRGESSEGNHDQRVDRKPRVVYSRHYGQQEESSSKAINSYVLVSAKNG